MKVLGIDTSAVSASVAIVEQGQVLGEHGSISPEGIGLPGPPGRANHSEVLLPLMEWVLRKQNLEFSDLAALGVSIGPGSFTGLRVGISTTKGLVYGSKLPVFGIRTLEAMARRVPSQEQEHFICPFMDARKGQVYAALFRAGVGGFDAVMNDTLDTATNVLKRVQVLATASCIFVGEGTRVYDNVIEEYMGEKAQLTTREDYPCTASGVALITEEKLIQGVPDSLPLLTPDYLRSPDAVPPKPKTL